MIRELGESVGDAIVESVGRAVGRSQEQRPLPADLLESEDAYLAVFDAPGAEAGDVQVRFEDGTVFARVDRFREFHEGFEMRFPGRGLTLDGSVELPEDAVVDAANASATLKDNGTLQVRVPKLDPEVEEEIAASVSTMDEEGVEPDSVSHDESDEDSAADTESGDDAEDTDPEPAIERVDDEDDA